MSYPVIEANQLGKRYDIGKAAVRGYQTIRESMISAVRSSASRFLRPRTPAAQDNSTSLWALRDVTFEIRTGEVVGIIGRNGSGKSTLLKILSRVTTPTEGTVDMVGRVGSLLEVGTGFHGELSGRENLFLNGAILGMPRSEVARKFDEIVAFAEVERFLDTPVKRYSSGMYMRLAFAIAAHLEPEILIVDEVLAVGDVGFQRKCIQKMDEVATAGRTVLFVSHNMGVIRQLCNRAILLRSGRIAMQGNIDEVISQYERDLSESAGEGVWDNPDPDTGADDAYLHRIEVTGEDGVPASQFLNTDVIMVHFHITVRKENDRLKIGFDFYKNGSVLWRISQVDSLNPPHLAAGRRRVTCHIPAHLLFLGEYLIQPQMSIHWVRDIFVCPAPVLRFAVQLNPGASPFHGTLNEKNHAGVLLPMFQWDVR